MKKYTPISCTFYDYIEHYAVKKTLVTIVYMNENGEQQSVQARIDDTLNNKKEEFICLSNGQKIRMDYLISINQHRLSDYGQQCSWSAK